MKYLVLIIIWSDFQVLIIIWSKKIQKTAVLYTLKKPILNNRVIGPKKYYEV